MAGLDHAADEQLVPEWLREALRARLRSEVGLPVLPDTACRVMAACQDERSDLRELAELVTHDPSLATHVLRVANSVAYAPKAPIRSLRQALGRLGLSTVSDIAIAVAIKQRVFAVPGHEERIHELWLHSTASAFFAKDVATLLHMEAEPAFLCGLLHDVGMPIVMQAACDIASERGAGILSRHTMEVAMDEFHQAFGLHVAQRWHLGPEICSAVYYHHDPTAARHAREMVLVVTLADELAHWAPNESLEEEDFLIRHGPGHDGLPEATLHTLLDSRRRILELARAFQ